MDSLETDDKLTIVNRSMIYRISKKLIRKVPYFEKMLSHDLKESKENKVILDFDEQALKLILNWLEFGFIFIEMNNVINLCTIADYFGANNSLIDDCFCYFHDNFTVEHLPVVIPQVTATSKLINSDSLGVFIRRYFMKIANTTVWLDYPIETIEYICALDLMVHSEVQVFEAIIKWVNFKADARKEHLKGLLKLIRWCYLEDKNLSKVKENELFKSSKFEPELRSNDGFDFVCTIDRTKQGCFVLIEEVGDKNLRIEVLDGNFLPIVNQVIQSDELMPLHVLHDEYVSDISYDSGRKMIRIDWKQAKYRLLDHTAYKSYYIKIHRCIFEDKKSAEYVCQPPSAQYLRTEGSLLESNDKFILVRYHEYWFKCWTTPTAENITSHFIDSGNSYLATVVGNNIYTLKNNLEFFRFNIDSKLEFNSIGLQRFEGIFNFDNLLLTSNQVGDDLVIIIEKSTKAVYCYNAATRKWSSMGRISSCDSRSADGQRESHKLITFTSTFLSMDTIKPTMKLN